MKPTEADIQAELDRHGLGFVVTETFSNSHTVLWYQIESENLHCQVLFFESYFKITDTESGEFIKFPISSKIEPNDEVLCHLPDKKEIFALCRSIVRLITGEQVEQTLEEAEEKPTYEFLEQRVEELEQQLAKLKAEYKELDDEFETTHQRHCQARKAMERYQSEMLDLKRDRDKLATNYQRECERAVKLQERVDKLERENASLLDKFGPIDQAEQMYAQADHQVKSFAAKLERWAQGIIQLNEEIL